jgi:hypothetical protein
MYDESNRHMSKTPSGPTETPEECPYHSDDLDKKGICWTCYDLLQEDLQRIDNEQWADERARHSKAEALALLQKADSIQFTLELFGLWGLTQILADREQTEALRLLIVVRDEKTLKVLFNCHKRGAKRGPRRKNGVHLEEEVLRLRRAGKSSTQIARLLKKTTNQVSAAYNNITDKIAREQIKDREQ